MVVVAVGVMETMANTLSLARCVYTFCDSCVCVFVLRARALGCMRQHASAHRFTAHTDRHGTHARARRTSQCFGPVAPQTRYARALYVCACV